MKKVLLIFHHFVIVMRIVERRFLFTFGKFLVTDEDDVIYLIKEHVIILNIIVYKNMDCVFLLLQEVLVA